MDHKERAAIVATLQENLLNVVGASGNPEKLVKVTTEIVQGTKRLVGAKGMPEDLTKRATDILSAFIKSASVIAKNPRGVDSKAIQEFSTNRKAVEKVVADLDKWHVNAVRRSSPVMELNEVVESITKPQENSHRNSPESPEESDREKKLTWELQRKRDTLLMKMDPQTNPPQVKDVGDTLMVAVKGLMRGAEELSKCTEGKLPAKESLLEPMGLITDMVCKLLDVVDNLFVSKYPMRSQVYSFCTALMDNVLAYGYRSKSDNATSLRSIATQTPALLNAAKVMVEQCEKRSNSIDKLKEQSIKRVHDIGELDDKDNLEVKSNKKPQPEPPAPKPEVKTEFEICCNVCTSVAVDQKTQQPISRGTELSLVVSPSTTVRDVKQDLATRTGLPFENIQFNQGQAELPDSFIINPQNTLPYFLFNKFEPSEDELLQQRKDERQKSRVKIYDYDWSKVKGPVAVALYEYDTLGDDSNLSFDEGEVIEIISKGGDNWWDGRIGDRCGPFPASFVQEISSKEEGIRLLKLMNRGKQTDDGQEESISSNRQLSDTSLHQPASAPQNSKPPKLKMRGMSNPDFSSLLSQDKNRVVSGIFKKKQKRTGYSNLTTFEENAIMEEKSPDSPEQTKKSEAKPLSKPKVSKTSSGPPKVPKVLGSEAPAAPPTSSPSEEANQPPPPQMNYKRTGQGMAKGKGEAPKGKGEVPKGKGEVPKKRAPPPRPPPFASTHPNQAAKLGKIIRGQEGIDTEEVLSSSALEDLEAPPTATAGNAPTKPKESDSMEDLLKNLQEFDECTSEHSYATLSEVQTSYDVDYEVISPPATTEVPEEVVTIKISDYKPDTDDELIEEDEEDGEEEELRGLEGSEDSGGVKPVDGLLFVDDDQWNPREWRPSPEPEVVRKPPKLKKPSWSVDVDSKGISKGTRSVSSSQWQQNNGGIAQLKAGSSPQLNLKSARTGSASPQMRNTPSPRFQVGDPTPEPTDVPRPPPTVMSRPKKSPTHSPHLANKHNHSAPSAPAGKNAPPPVPPPRQKRKPMGAPGRAAPPPPAAKPKGFTSSHSDMDLHGSNNKPVLSQLGERRWTVSQQRDQLRFHKQPTRSRSPVVQRKTRAVMGEGSHLAMSGIPENGQDYTGVGKEGILLKESSANSVRDWKPRFFQLVEDGLLYYESLDSPSRVSRPLGEIPLNRMVKAIPIGERDQLHCFAILMRYETSVVLGCHSIMELEDWLCSLNEVIEIYRLQSKPSSYMPSIKAAEYCLEYLLNTPMELDKNIFKLSGDLGIIKGWLQQIDEGEEADLSFLSNPSSALCMLKSLFTDDGKLPYLVQNEIAKEISQQVKKSSPVRDIQSKLHHIPDESLHILQMFLKLFSKILEQKVGNKKHKLEVADLNRMFGSALFEGLKSNHSLTLLSYLISTHELMF